MDRSIEHAFQHFLRPSMYPTRTQLVPFWFIDWPRMITVGWSVEEPSRRTIGGGDAQSGISNGRKQANGTASGGDGWIVLYQQQQEQQHPALSITPTAARLPVSTLLRGSNHRLGRVRFRRFVCADNSNTVILNAPITANILPLTCRVVSCL